MIFRINYPSEITAPKGLNIPSLENIIQAVNLAEIVASYANVNFDDDAEFTTAVSDEVNVLDGKLVDSHNTGEGVVLYPSHNPWNMESILASILHALFEQ